LMVTSAIGFAVVLIVFWSPIEELALSADYEGSISIALAWAAYVVALALATGLTLTLQAVRDFSTVARSNIVGTIIAILTLFPMYHWTGLQGIVYGMAFGEAVIGGLLFHRVRSLR